MVEAESGDRIVVHTDGDAGLYLTVDAGDAERVRAVLIAAEIEHSVDRDAVSSG